MQWRFACVCLAAFVAWGQRPIEEDTAAAVERTRRLALAYEKSLPDFMCTQVVHRYQDLVHRGLWRPHDILTIKLNFTEHKEDHKLMLVNGKSTGEEFSGLAGAITVGEFGTTLLQIFDPESKASFTWEKLSRIHKRSVAVYAYRVDTPNSRYALNYAIPPNKRSHLLVGFHGTVEVDQETGEVLRYTYIADNIPKGFPIQGAQTMVEYDWEDIGGRQFLLPATSETEMKSVDIWARNKAEFRDYRKFIAESSLTFDTGK